MMMPSLPQSIPSLSRVEPSAGWPRRVRLFQIELDAVNLAEAAGILIGWTREPSACCRYVVTPNVDHLVMLDSQPSFQAAYRAASLVVADGWPVVAVSRWLGRPLPERVAGSDLVPALFSAADPARPLRTFLLGAGPGVAARAAEIIPRRWPGVHVVGVDSPPVGFERQPEENKRILACIADAQPDLVIVGLGAPKQELWVHAHRESISAKVVICAGATIDFLAGEKPRAPRWMQRCGLEFLHRILKEPRRLARRYLHDAAVFPRLAWREWRSPSA